MILIDDRAGSKELIHIPPLNKEAELGRLDSGDALITGNGPDGPVLVGVEVKSMSDLISSSNTGRLQGKQMPELLEEYDVAWLAHYGRYRCEPITGNLQILTPKNRWKTWTIGNKVVPYGYVESMLMTLTALGINVKRLATENETAQWIACLARWWNKPWDKHRGLHSFDNSREVSLLPGMTGDMHARAKVAAQLPGVGFERAVAAAKHFGSIAEMMNAPKEEWEKIPGIGKVIAGAVTEAIRG